MHINIQEIVVNLKKKLPGEISHKKMLPDGRILEAPSYGLSGIKKSSVLLLLFPENDEIFTCLIKRPAHMKHHAGQIALPGGRIENNESAIDTALRETAEEIGIHSEKVKILGQLSELYVEVSRFIIQPFVGWLNEKPQFIINRNEVEKIILFPLYKYMTAREYMDIKTITGKLQVPCIKYKQEIIWGATAMILSEFYDVTNHLISIHQKH